MSSSIPDGMLEKFTTFGDLLRYLRRVSGLTQLELSVQVGYSHAQISRLEQNLRLPDIPTIQARFIPALWLQDEPKAVERLLELASNMRREDAPDPGLCPYKGLNYFDISDAKLFVGREALTAKLVELVHCLISNNFPDQGRFLAIIGASGSGKSSLARAGLVPALQWHPASADWDIQVLTPTAHPLQSLAESLTKEANSVLSAVTLIDDLRRDNSGLALFAERKRQQENSSRLLLVVDQFEELFTLCRSEEEKLSFINNLLTAARETNGPIIVIIVMRADFYAHCAAYDHLRQMLANHQEYIGAMCHEELQRAIEEPARQGNWKFEPGLVDLLLHDVGHEPGALPLLSHALLETWLRRRGHTLTLSGYAASGGVRGAIAETAEAVFVDQLTSQQRAIARRLFLRLTELGGEASAADTRRRVTFKELILDPNETAITQEVLKILADARLVITGEDSAEVAHEALIREWPTLRGWLEENREELRLHRHLTEAAQEWAAMQREPGMLYRGGRLAQVREWATTHADEMNALEREFMLESLAASELEASEREDQRRRELEAAKRLADTERQASARLRVRHWVITGIGIIAVFLAVLAGTFAVNSDRNAQKAQADAVRADAEYLAIAANSLKQNDGDSNLTALLAIRSLVKQYTPSGDAVLTSLTMKESAPREFIGHSAEIFNMAFSPDGKYLATASGDQTAVLWDVASGKILRIFEGHRINVEGLAFSPDGKTLVTISHDTTIRLWDVASGENRKIFQAPHGTVTLNNTIYSVAYAPNGRFIATAGVDDVARIWDVETGEIIHKLIGHTQNLTQVAYSPNGEHILTGSQDGTVRLWDSATGENVSIFNGHARDIKALAFTPDGKSIATGNDYAIWLWDIATRDGGPIFTGHERGSEVSGIAFSPDGKMMASVGTDGTARLWDVASGHFIRFIGGRGEILTSVKFSPDGKQVAIAGNDKIARVWSLQTFPAGMEFNQGVAVRKASLSLDGKRIAIASYDHTARIWDAMTAQTHVLLNGHTDEVTDAEFSPDGQTVVTASADHTAKLWNAAEGMEIRTFQGHTDVVEQAVISPDGKNLLTTSYDGTARIWDLQTGETLFTYNNLSPGEVPGAAFSPDGKIAATSGSENTAQTWDVHTGKELNVFKGHTDIVAGIALSPNGKYLLTSSWDGTSRLWEVASGKEIRRFEGHAGKVYGAAFSSDGKMVLTSGEDKTARMWDTETGQELRLFSGHTGEVRYVAFEPNGRSILTSSVDGTARLWLINLQDTIQTMCASLTRDLTPEERTQYGITDQAPTCPMQ